MNIETGTLQNIKQSDSSRATSGHSSRADKDFKSEMADLKSENDRNIKSETTNNDNESFTSDTSDVNSEYEFEQKYKNSVKSLGSDTDVLVSTIEEINNSLDQTDDFDKNLLKEEQNQPDINFRPSNTKELNDSLLNNDMNLQNINNDKKMPELKADINFAQNSNEMFSSFLGSNSFQESADEMQEDASVLSTMAENVAMVNRVLTEKTASAKEIGGVEKVGQVVDKTINASTLNMTRTDVQLFINLANGNNFDINEVTQAQEASKSGMVSETLANLMAESMKNNRPFRINFDNDISVIIKLSKEGRISANFIPGSDAAENYLRNNLSNLVQTFEDENLPYDELTHQRQRRDNEQEQNKKDNNNE